MNSFICSPKGAAHAPITSIRREIKDANKYMMKSDSPFLVDLVYPKTNKVFGGQPPIKYSVKKGVSNILCDGEEKILPTTVACDNNHELELEFEVPDQTLAAYAEIILENFDKSNHEAELKKGILELTSISEKEYEVLPSTLFYQFCRVVRDPSGDNVRIIDLEKPHKIPKILAKDEETRKKYKRFLAMCSLLDDDITIHIRGHSDIHLTMYAHDSPETDGETVEYKTKEVVYDDETDPEMD